MRVGHRVGVWAEYQLANGPGGRAHGAVFSHESRRLWVSRAQNRDRSPSQLEVWDLAVSPNGKYIAFNRIAEDGSTALVVTDQDGGNATDLSPDESESSSFDWAPDSKHIVFVSETSGNAEIYVATPDGKDINQLTSNRVIDAAPRWNSKGSSILFLSEGDGSYDIYSMNKDGERQVRMTTMPDLIIEADW